MTDELLIIHEFFDSNPWIFGLHSVDLRQSYMFPELRLNLTFRYDGQRAQIHLLLDGTVRIFSRNGDETTSKFPDLVDVIKQFACPTAETFMLDAEVGEFFILFTSNEAPFAK